MKLLRILGIGLFLLGGLATLAVIIDERVSRQASAWDRDYGGRFAQKGGVG